MSKEKVKKIINPSLIFIILLLIVVVLSGVLAYFNVSASYFKISSTTGELTTEYLTITSLFNRTGIQYILGNMATNFASFSPLSMVIIGLMSMGLFYKSNFLKAIFYAGIKKIPKKLITFLIILLGVLSSVVSDVGYIFLLPLAAYIFILNNRNPLLGITAAFAGITFGYGANFFLSGTDALLLQTTREATNMIYSSYYVNLYGNIIFMIVATLVISYVATIITEKITTTKLGKYTISEDVVEEYELDSSEKRGLRSGLIAVLVMLIILVYCIIPSLPFSGLLLDLSKENYIDQLFGVDSYFAGGIVFIIAIIITVGSIFYLKGSKKNKDNNYFMKLMASSLENIGSIMILVFFASQFIAIFKKTNIGPVIVALLGNLVNSLQFSGIALIILVFIIILVSNILIPAATSKWVILAPSIVTAFVDVNMSPEFAMAVYRAADSVTNGLTPLLGYFVIFIGFLEIFKDKNTQTISTGSCLKLMTPYAIFLGLTWFVLIIIFYLVKIPLGIGIFPSL